MEKLRGTAEIHSTPTSPRQPHANHFSGKTLRSLFTTKRADNPRSPSVATSSIFSSGNGTVRSGMADAKGTTNGRMRDKLNMGTSRRRSDLSGTVKDAERHQDVTMSRVNPVPTTGSRLMQGTIASRSRAAQSMPPPSTTSVPAASRGTVRFPGQQGGLDERVVSPTSTEESEIQTPSLPVAPTTTRKKKHSLSLFLSSTKARASLSSTGSAAGTETSKRSANADISKSKDTVKARVTSNPVGGATYMASDMKRSQTTVKGPTMGKDTVTARGRETLKSGHRVVQKDQDEQATVRANAERPSGFRPRKEKDAAPEMTYPNATSSRTTSATASRIHSPNPSHDRPAASGTQNGAMNGQEGDHFVLRLAVTYLTKTVLPEIRSSRRESHNGRNSTSQIPSNPAHGYRKDLIEKLRPLERMERSWGIDWMLRGKEGFKVSSRTREKERDTFRQAIEDGSLLLFLTDRSTTDGFRTVKLRLDAVVAACRALHLSLDENINLEDIVIMDGIQVYTAATLVVALARFAGPRAKQGGSDDIRSRSPSPVRRDAARHSETGQGTKHRPEPVAIVKVHEETASKRLSGSSDRQSLRRTSESQRMAIRMPAGNYYASNPMHSKLDTVLSMTPGEGGFTPALATSDAFEGYFSNRHSDARPASPSKPILKSSIPASDEEGKSASLTESSVPFRFHSRDPTPSLISGTTDRTSMALSDPPERAPRSISFASNDGETKRQIKNAIYGHVDIVKGQSDRQTPFEDPPMTPVSVSAARFRPRVQRGVTIASSISSMDGIDRPPSRRNSEIKPGRPQYIPRRHTTQAPNLGTPPRQGDLPAHRHPSITRKASGSQGQPYSPPATPRRAMSPSFSDSPWMPSSRRTSFTSAASQSPAGRDSFKPLVVVKDIEGRVQTYQLGNCIGKGQFGIVYRALNLANGQFVAVKRITLENLDEDIEQIMKEVEVLKRLKHPSIVRYLGMARDEKYLDIILEYVEGGSLANASRSFGKFSEHLVACYAAKMLEGLHYLHGEDVVHCDLKAANILITKKADVRLTDFGVSLNLRAVENQKDDNVVGTPNWVAPEIISLQGASTASDIWSLGCTIVELLEGKPPWSELDSNMAVLFKIVEEEWPIPSYYSEELKSFLGLCFKKNPSERPTAETLFDHDWIRNEIGLDPRLRNHDSIPFLRRISGDAVRLQQLRFDAGPPTAFSHLRDASSPIDISFRDWKVDKHRPGLSEYAYSSPCRPDLRSTPGSSFSVRSDDTDPGQARPADLIEAERQRALNKLTNGHQSTSSNLPAVTPILQVHYPTRAKERLERLRESDGRRGSAETDSTTRPSPASRERVISNDNTREHDGTIRPSSSHSGPQTSALPSIIKHQSAERQRYDQGHLLEDKADTKGECTVQ